MAGNEIGASGLNRSNDGQITEEFLPNLQGRKAIEAFKEMSENDPVVGAVLFAIEMVVRSVKWVAEENPDGADPEAEAQYIQECMDDMSHTWTEHISEVLSMLRYGWSFFEIVYKKRNGFQKEGSGTPSSAFDDGKVGWHKFAIRSQDSLQTWKFGDGGGLEAMVQIPPPDYKVCTIPITKALLFRTSSAKGNPEGRSALRNAYRPWYLKKHIEEQEAVGIERDLAGIPLAKVDAQIMREDATTEEKAVLQAIIKIVQNIKRNKQDGIVWPRMLDENGNDLYTIELLSGGGSRQYNTTEIIQRYDQRIAMTVLGDFILLGHETVGSFALSSDKTDLFAVALGAYLDIMQEVYNRFAVPRLLEMNGLTVENPPKIVHKDIEPPNLTELITYIGGLVQAGVELFPDEQLEKHLREVASLPEKSADAPDTQQDQQQGVDDQSTDDGY